MDQEESSERSQSDDLLDFLHITSCGTSFTLNNLKLHLATRSDGAITLTRDGSKVEEDIFACFCSCDHANACVDVKPADDALRNWEAIRP